MGYFENRELLDFLLRLSEGAISDAETAPLVRILKKCWPDLPGSNATEMSAYKLDRLELGILSGFSLSFCIERHPPSGTTIQLWEFNMALLIKGHKNCQMLTCINLTDKEYSERKRNWDKQCQARVHCTKVERKAFIAYSYLVHLRDPIFQNADEKDCILSFISRILGTNSAPLSDDMVVRFESFIKRHSFVNDVELKSPSFRTLTMGQREHLRDPNNMRKAYCRFIRKADEDILDETDKDQIRNHLVELLGFIKNEPFRTARRQEEMLRRAAEERRQEKLAAWHIETSQEVQQGYTEFHAKTSDTYNNQTDKLISQEGEDNDAVDR